MLKNISVGLEVAERHLYVWRSRSGGHSILLVGPGPSSEHVHAFYELVHIHKEADSRYSAHMGASHHISFVVGYIGRKLAISGGGCCLRHHFRSCPFLSLISFGLPADSSRRTDSIYFHCSNAPSQADATVREALAVDGNRESWGIRSGAGEKKLETA